MMARQVGRHAKSLYCALVFETVSLIRRVCAEPIRAREPSAPNERPDICLQLTQS